jgi:hypothetical protein
LSSSGDARVLVAAEHGLIDDEQQEAPVVMKAIPRTIWHAGTPNKPSENAQFKGNSVTSSITTFNQLQRPIEYFRLFRSRSLPSDLVTDCIVGYSAQTRTEKPVKITEFEVKQFTGVCLYMSLIRIASTRSYWSNDFRVHHIADDLTLNRFKEIERFCPIPFADNSHYYRLIGLYQFYEIYSNDRLFSVLLPATD